jgi:hypothetical protein
VSVLGALLEGASKALDVIRAAEPFFSASGKVRLRTVLLELGEIIADEIEKERFGRSSTEPAMRAVEGSEAPPPASTKPEGID